MVNWSYTVFSPYDQGTYCLPPLRSQHICYPVSTPLGTPTRGYKVAPPNTWPSTDAQSTIHILVSL